MPCSFLPLTLPVSRTVTGRGSQARDRRAVSEFMHSSTIKQQQQLVEEEKQQCGYPYVLPLSSIYTPVCPVTSTSLITLQQSISSSQSLSSLLLSAITSSCRRPTFSIFTTIFKSFFFRSSIQKKIPNCKHEVHSLSSFPLHCSRHCHPHGHPRSQL